MSSKVDWKDISRPDRAENAHRRNEVARSSDRAADNLGNRLREAFHKQKKPADGVAHKAVRAGGVHKSPPSVPDGMGTTKLNSPVRTDRTALPIVKQAPAPIAKQATKPVADAGVQNVYRNPPASSQVSFKNPATVSAASQFVVAPKETPLNNLLLKRPVAIETKLEKEMREAEGNPLKVLKEPLTLKVQGPIASDAGAKLSDATTRREESKTNKKRDDKKAELDKKGGKKVASQNAGRATHDAKLEAASSGVASSGGDDPVWLADLESGVEIINPENQLDDNMAVVLREQALLNRHVYKNDPTKAVAAEAVLKKALALNDDPELNRVLELGLAARLNVYGVTGG